MTSHDRIRVCVELNGEPIVLGKVERVPVRCRPCPQCGERIAERGPRLCSRCACLAWAEAVYQEAKAEAAELQARAASDREFWWLQR